MKASESILVIYVSVVCIFIPECSRPMFPRATVVQWYWYISYIVFPTNLPLFLLKRFWTLAVDRPPFPSRLFVFVVRKRLVHSDALTHQITTCRQFYKTDINTRRIWLQNILIWEHVVVYEETIDNNFESEIWRGMHLAFRFQKLGLENKSLARQLDLREFRS